MASETGAAPGFDAWVALRAGFPDGAEATALQARLADEVPWTVHRIRMFGRWVDSPRLSCWMGDPQARYRYAGALFEPLKPATTRRRPVLTSCTTTTGLPPSKET